MTKGMRVIKRTRHKRSVVFGLSRKKKLRGRFDRPPFDVHHHRPK